MPRDPRTLALLAHLAAYLVAVAISAAVNLWLSPDRLWFVWIAAGWGIGVAAHALAFWLAHTRRRERVFLDPHARGFAVHAFAYVAVVVLLFIVNVTVTPKVWWFYWVALGWGAGVLAHGWCVFFRKCAPSGRRPPSPRLRPRSLRRYPRRRTP
ncbi:MAG: 2TM domain-containing protein [Alphaproteobacteria bacterium]|jgi:hypothetical protein|uniref:2TM domain-containing protein n=1 Tax=Methyloceanibacter sp. TaxID=1965321 RepID=UPI003563106B